MTPHHKTLLLLSLSVALLPLGGGNALAQDLSLFEPVEQVESAPRPDTRRQQAPGNIEPEFTLVGTSRIGNRVSATLLSRNGSTVVVRGNEDGNIDIPGHSGYQISSIQPRQVAVAYPSGTPCVEAPDRGVQCNGNVAALSLTTAAPIVVEQPQERNETAALENQPADGEVAEDAPSENPFAAALRAAAAEAPEDVANRRAEAQRFQARRINPEDVPEGMRLVRTPFGDRLIQE